MKTQPRQPVQALRPQDALPVDPKQIHQVDPKQIHQVLELPHTKPLTTCRVHPAGQYVFAGAEDLNVYRWDLETKEKTTLEGHESWVRSIDFSPATESSPQPGSSMVTADWTGFVIFWDPSAEEPKPLKKIQAHQGATRWVRYSPDGTQVATCGNDNLIKLWTSEGEPIREFAGHERHPYAVSFHPDGKTIASEDLMGIVKLWDVNTGEELKSIKTKMTGYDPKFAADMGGARDMVYHPSGKQFACAGITNVKNSFAGVQDVIFVLVTPEEADEKKVTQVLSTGKAFQGVAWGIRFHPENFIVGGAADRSGKGSLWFWKDDKPEPFHTFPLKVAARGIDFTPDARQIAVAHSDGKLRLYQMTEKMV